MCLSLLEAVSGLKLAHFHRFIYWLVGKREIAAEQEMFKASIFQDLPEFQCEYYDVAETKLNCYCRMLKSLITRLIFVSDI